MTVVIHLFHLDFTSPSKLNAVITKFVRDQWHELIKYVSGFSLECHILQIPLHYLQSLLVGVHHQLLVRSRDNYPSTVHNDWFHSLHVFPIFQALPFSSSGPSSGPCTVRNAHCIPPPPSPVPTGFACSVCRGPSHLTLPPPSPPQVGGGEDGRRRQVAHSAAQGRPAGPGLRTPSPPRPLLLRRQRDETLAGR